MSNSSQLTPSQELAREYIHLADSISRRLYRRYSWVGLDDLHSYSYLGLTLAAEAYDGSRGVPFDRFACTKAMYLAIDEMRKDGVLRRADTTARDTETTSMEIDLPDPAADRDHEQLVAREFCSELLRDLDSDERRLLMMVYVEKLTYREIGAVFGITESAVCLRHKALLERLRKQNPVRQLAA